MPVVAEFLHVNLNRRVPPLTWTYAMSSPWKTEAPNHGFAPRRAARAGAYLAFDPSARSPDDGRFRNLASWCALPEFRFHSVRLLKALLAEDGYHFTDLAPTGNVIPLNAGSVRFLETSAASCLTAVAYLATPDEDQRRPVCHCGHAHRAEL